MKTTAIDYIIETTHLTKKYGKRLAVDDLSFQIKPGQTLGLLGPNGAGKSTTIRMLMGLAKPTSGSATIFGLDLTTQTKQIQSQIGVVFEKPNLYENLSGYENLATFCRLFKRPLSLIRPLLERMDLWDRATEPVKVYSKGMRQRILILRALVHQPQLLFLDEPCSGLDPVSSRIIRDYLLDLKQSGVTILLTSHDMEEVDELCDLIGFINNGKLIALSEKNTLKAAYGSYSIKIIYRKDHELIQEVMIPTPENLLRLSELYSSHQVVSLHSMEASLSETFRKLSALP
ncbi:MAG: ABC transporter ATP-binding protein [Firmicutes bacterium]|nr:ABC transporter ATP-binding protein [Bacillota bacterium]